MGDSDGGDLFEGFCESGIVIVTLIFGVDSALTYGLPGVVVFDARIKGGIDGRGSRTSGFAPSPFPQFVDHL